MKTFNIKRTKNTKVKYTRIFKIKYTRTPICSFQSNEASVLEHFAPIFLYLFYSTRFA
jgi:hypothetical protein